MPKVVKRKPSGTGGAVAGGPKKKGNLYNKPEKIKEGTILRDLTKTEWKIGPSIGTGGFGDIYTACKVGEKNYDYVIKCEPHDNGPLFVEMHFYMRNAKQEDLIKFKKSNGLRNLGIPHMLGNGSVELNSVKHRFLILPRLGSDINKFYMANGKRLPEVTVYRIVLQMLDAYKFVHDCGYVHADLKAANILLGVGKEAATQVYLVDFGLAAHYTTKAFKPDPKKMHNGTIEYTSRDAHMGVATMRGDMEILAYNIIDWLGADLPWVKDNLLTVPGNVQNLKEDFMANFNKQLTKLFPRGQAPNAVIEYVKYVANMEYNETPDYAKCRKIFTCALIALKVPIIGELIFTEASTSASALPGTSKAMKIANRAGGGGARLKTKQEANHFLAIAKSEPSDDEYDDDQNDSFVINASDDDDGDVLTYPKKKTPKQNKIHGKKLLQSPIAASIASRKATASKHQSPVVSKSPSPSKRSKLLDNKHTPSQLSIKNSTPINAKTHVRLSPAIKMSPSRLQCPGKTIINDAITPNGKAHKTYEFNFELDVSLDANVIVNVKRKKKALERGSHHGKDVPKVNEKEGGKGKTNSNSSPSTSLKTNTPVSSKVKVRKVDDETNDGNNSPRTPVVTVRKSKRLLESSR